MYVHTDTPHFTHRYTQVIQEIYYINILYIYLPTPKPTPFTHLYKHMHTDVHKCAINCTCLHICSHNLIHTQNCIQTCTYKHTLHTHMHPWKCMCIFTQAFIHIQTFID